MALKKEERELIIKDICSRLAFGNVKVRCRGYIEYVVAVTPDGEFRLQGWDEWYNIKEITAKPFLRPLSDMTAEELNEYGEIVMKSQDCSFENNESATTMVNDWYLSKNFDTRGLIKKGLAIEDKK